MLQDVQLENIQKKHNTEKQKAFQDLDDYKLKITNKEKDMYSNFQLKFDSQEDNINRMNFKFNEKITNFEIITNELKVLLEKNKNKYVLDMNELKISHENEMIDMTKVNNGNYTKMLNEQMRAQGEE